MGQQRGLEPTGISTIDAQHSTIFEMISMPQKEESLTQEFLMELFRKIITHYTTEEVILLIFHEKESQDFRSHHLYHQGILELLRGIMEKKMNSEPTLEDYERLKLYLGRDDIFDESLYDGLNTQQDKKTSVITIITEVQEYIEAIFEKGTPEDMIQRYETNEIKKN